jgi:hypothetical protein
MLKSEEIFNMCGCAFSSAKVLCSIQILEESLDLLALGQLLALLEYQAC